MPVATVSTDARTYELKSAPPDGYVIIRQMSYGESMERQDILVRMSTETPSDSNDGAIRIGGEKVTWEMANFATSLFDFQRCVTDHNLTDPNGRKLNLSTAHDLRALDPRVGQEIDGYIREMNRFDEQQRAQFREGSSRVNLEPVAADSNGGHAQGSGDIRPVQADELTTEAGRVIGSALDSH